MELELFKLYQKGMKGTGTAPGKYGKFASKQIFITLLIDLPFLGG
jgi:hypothetical protein